MKRKSFVIGLVIVFFCSITFLSAFAAYLRNVPVTLKQPDGTAIHCLATGDEFHNWLHDSNNYTIIQNPVTGYYVYAELSEGKLSASDHIVGESNPALLGLSPGLNISAEEIEKKRFSRMKTMGLKTHNKSLNTGTINNIVIFIRFADQTEYTDSWATYNNNFNAASGVSMKSYFQTVSSSQLTINSTLYPAGGASPVSYQDSHNRNYFEPYNATTNPNGYSTTDNDVEKRTREHTLLNAAATYCSAAIVASGLNIDQDSDGDIDNVCFIIQGSVGAWNDLLWPHRWALYSQTVTIGGKRVYDYNFQVQNSFGVGVLSHEMFHTLGAPDLYHYGTTGLNPVSTWDLMGATYTSTPQHMSAYMKKTYGGWFSTLPTISTAGTYSLSPLNTSPNACYKIASPNSASEYFMVEYRNASGNFESVLPGSGLIISRITPSLNGNSNGPPNEVYVYRPGGTTAVDGTVGSANFSSNVGRTSFTNTTNPRCFLTNNADAGINITNITSAGATISFDVSFPSPVVLNPPQSLGYSMSSRDCILTWSAPVASANTLSGYKVYRNSSLINTITNPATLTYTDLSLADGAYSYYVIATYSSPVGESAASNTVSFTLSSTAPDFEIENEASSSGSVELGSTIAFSCDIENNGTATGGASTLAYYISTDVTLDGGDTKADTDAVSSLTVGGSSSQTTTLRIISPTPAGTYYLIFSADDDGDVSELDENNNTAYVQFQVTSVTTDPDLALSGLSVTPTSVVQGNTVTTDCDVDNNTSVTAGASTLKYYLSSDATYDGGDTYLGSDAVASIAASGHSSESSVLTIPGGTTAGTWYIIFIADADNDVTEDDETNNEESVQIQVTSPAGSPDFVISNQTSSSGTVQLGDPITFSCDVENNGTASSGTSTLAYFLSDDTTLDGGDTQMDTDAIPTLAVGASSSQSVQVSIVAPTPPGTYYAIFVADYDDDVTESNENNNTAYVQIVVQAASSPDYSPINLSVTPTTVEPGSTITADGSVKNNSTTTAGGISTLKYYLSSDATYDGTDVLLGNKAVAALAASAQSNHSTILTIPVGTAVGGWYILFYVDADGDVSESDETNNVGSILISVQAASIPDYELAHQSVDPTTVTAGNNLLTSVDITNQSTVIAPGTEINYYLSLDQTYDIGDNLIGFSNTTAGFTAGETHTINETITIPSTTTPGSWNLIFYADAGSLVAEGDETNNIVYVSIVVTQQLPDLNITNESILPVQVYQGSDFSISCDVLNDGFVNAATSTMKYYLSDDTTYDLTDRYVGDENIPEIPASSQVDIKSTQTLPLDVSEGYWYVFYFCDADDVILESDETNNLAYYRVEVMRTLPDLYPDNLLIVPQIVDPGDTFNTSVDVENLIPVIAPPGEISYYLSSDDTYDINDLLLGTASFPGFAGLETHTVIKSLTIASGSAPGNFYLIAIVDKDEAIEESDETNNIDSGIIKIEDLSGINDHISANIKVFPNPANGKFYFESDIIIDRNYMVQVINLLGKTVFSRKFYQENNTLSGVIDISLESKGTYILRISSEKNEFLKKVIIR